MPVAGLMYCPFGGCCGGDIGVLMLFRKDM